MPKGAIMAAVEESVPTATAKAPILVLDKLDKRFGATHALKTVDLTNSRRIKLQ